MKVKRHRPLKRILIATAIVIVGLPIAHMAYDRYHVPEVPEGTEEWRLRNDALARARVFVASPPSIDGLDLTRNPQDPNPFGPESEITCRYDPKATSGTTPKFDCILESGEVIKVKYGLNPEIPGEVAATRLLRALGFGADHMTIVKRVRCYGCPRSPFRSRQVAEWFFIAGLLEKFLDFEEHADFDKPAVERKLEGRTIEAGEVEGWSWHELQVIDAARGGASRAEVDAFRLMALFLSHWDNKSSNQRLVCLGEPDDEAVRPCASPLAIIQDAGATFGPRKVDFLGWKHAPLWKESQGCKISMSHLPYGGATFQDADITEAGRALLASKLTALSDKQIHDLFSAANFPDPETGVPGTTNIAPWVETFKVKRAEIAGRRCPQ